MADRSNALLTSGHRDKLREEGGDGEHSRQYRQRIRNRTRNGTIDLGILFEHMEARDVKQVFGPDVGHLHELRNVVEEVRLLLGGGGSKRSLRDRVDELEALVQEHFDIYRQIGQHVTDNQTGDSHLSRQELADRRESSLQSIHHSAVEIVEEYREWLDNVEQARNKLEGLPDLDRFDTEYRDHIASLIDGLEELHQRALSDREELKQVVKEIDHRTQRSKSAPPELVGNLMSSLESIRRPRHRVWPELSNFDHQIRMDLRQTEFDKERREDVVSALAFYFRVSEILGSSTEELIEDAVAQMHEREHPDEVVGHVTVDVAVDDRKKAAKQGSRKLTEDNTRLSSTELRAVAETEPSLLSEMQRRDKITEAELREAVLENPDQLEEGMDIVDAEPQAPGKTLVPDLVAKDNQGDLVLIELKHFASIEQDPESTTDRLRELINQYGGEDRVRGFLVVPDFELEEMDEETPLHKVLIPERSIELKSVSLDPH